LILQTLNGNTALTRTTPSNSTSVPPTKIPLTSSNSSTSKTNGNVVNNNSVNANQNKDTKPKQTQTTGIKKIELINSSTTHAGYIPPPPSNAPTMTLANASFELHLEKIKVNSSTADQQNGTNATNSNVSQPDENFEATNDDAKKDTASNNTALPLATATKLTSGANSKSDTKDTKDNKDNDANKDVKDNTHDDQNKKNTVDSKDNSDKTDNIPGPPSKPPPEIDDEEEDHDRDDEKDDKHTKKKSFIPNFSPKKLFSKDKDDTNNNNATTNSNTNTNKKKHNLPDNMMSERDFYKKYWIESGTLGEGSFASVRKITRKADKEVFAFKMIKKKKKGISDTDIVALQKEIYVLQKCDHSNIVHLLDWCDTKKRLYMIVEFCDGGDVFERVIQFKKFSEKNAAHVIRQVASGLQHLHSKGFVHRDLKPDNIMYLTKDENSVIKIIDFGLAGGCNIAPCTTPCGTAHYAAPEVLSGQNYDQSSDMWSLGIILYTLLCGFPPFFDANNNMKNLHHLIKKAKFDFPATFWSDISSEAKDLISKLIVKDPKSRLTAEQVLSQPWVVKDAPDTVMPVTYVQQLSDWQTKRRQTEVQVNPTLIENNTSDIPQSP